MYAISVQIEHRKDGWRGSRGLPTFYLDENVQGITSEDHAALIAASIVNPFGEHADGMVHVCAVKVPS